MPSRKRARELRCRAARAFIGAHSATDTLYEWPDYGRLVGAYFKEHPWTQQGTVIVEDPSHPAAAGLGDRFALIGGVLHVPREPTAARTGAAAARCGVGGRERATIRWRGAHSFGGGRAYYNALGHFPGTGPTPLSASASRRHPLGRRPAAGTGPSTEEMVHRDRGGDGHVSESIPAAIGIRTR